MGKRGTKRQPTKVKLARGTHRADRDGDPSRIPMPPTSDIHPPSDLGDTGQAVWSRVATLLSTLDVVTDLDLLAFHTYCRAHDEIEKCDLLLASEGETFTTDKGTICQHPMVNQRFKWLDLKRRYEAEFGMTPSSRSSVQTTRPPANRVAKRQRA